MDLRRGSDRNGNLHNTNREHIVVVVVVVDACHCRHDYGLLRLSLRRRVILCRSMTVDVDKYSAIIDAVIAVMHRVGHHNDVISCRVESRVRSRGSRLDCYADGDKR